MHPRRDGRAPVRCATSHYLTSAQPKKISLTHTAAAFVSPARTVIRPRLCSRMTRTRMRRASRLISPGEHLPPNSRATASVVRIMATFFSPGFSLPTVGQKLSCPMLFAMTCLVAREIATERVVGFYTLSSCNVPLTEVPEKLAKKLPRYPTIPAVLIGWLGRHSDYAGQGLGEALVFDAIKTVATAPIGAHAIFADAIDDKAAVFYATFGFTPLIQQPRTLYLLMAAALSLLSP